MPIKDKKVIAQSKKRNKPGHKNVLDIIDKIFSYWSFKHLKSLIKKKDTPEIVSLIIIIIIFTKIFPYASKQDSTLFGLPYWFIVGVLFVIVLLFAIFMYRRKDK
jgi:uncharacterized membrane protein YhdT